MTKIIIGLEPFASTHFHEVEYEIEDKVYEATLIVMENDNAEPSYEIEGVEGEVKDEIKEQIIEQFLSK